MPPKILRILHTFTFRLALVYVGLFSLSVILLFAFIYTFSVNYLQGQVADNVRMRYYYLVNEYRQNGSAGVETRIKELLAEDDDGTEIYLLVNREYEKLAGNLNEWPGNAIQQSKFEKEGNWVQFNIEGSRSNPSVEVKAIAIALSKWRMLLVGESLQSNQKVEQTIVQTFWASLAVTLIMAFIGAIVMTRSVIRRLSVINRSTVTIMQGNLSARVPYTSGGDEFDELAMNLNQMLDRIEHLLQSLGQFANNIAHDLRSPLNRIISRLDAALRGIDEHNTTRKLLEKNIRDMEELVGTFNSILRISELEASTQFRQFEPCDIQALIAKLTEFYEPLAHERHISLTTTMDGPLLVKGEKNLLTQAFSNLLDNALKFTPEGGQITVAGCMEEGCAVIVIADSGPGISAEYRDKVFEKFFRLEQSRHTRGNGLGLSLVAAIARIHNAHIVLEDNAPGLRVRIVFPL